MQFNQYFTMEVADDNAMLLDNHYSEYRANQEARNEGMKGRNKELKLRRVMTNTYCCSVCRRYEDVLRYKL